MPVANDAMAAIAHYLDRAKGSRSAVRKCTMQPRGMRIESSLQLLQECTEYVCGCRHNPRPGAIDRIAIPMPEIDQRCIEGVRGILCLDCRRR